MTPRPAGRRMPSWVEPMLATLSDRPFSRAGWIFERKFDGERCLVFRSGRQVRLFTRNHKSLNDTYPELADAVAAQKPQAMILDGEIVAFEGKVTSFSRLQERMQIKDRREALRSRVAVRLYLFDILWLGERDTSGLSQRRRKQLLKESLAFRDPLRYTPHRNGSGEACFRQACKRGWEGIIAKDASAPYVHQRSTSWRKFKCINDQEFVVGGYTDPAGSRTGFGALLVGYYDGGRLHYAGKVGTGFDTETLGRLHRRLGALETRKPPFEPAADLPRADVHWTRPVVVAQVGFEEWTDGLRLRQPRFLGLRDDKRAAEVRREVPGA